MRILGKQGFRYPLILIFALAVLPPAGLWSQTGVPAGGTGDVAATAARPPPGDASAAGAVALPRSFRGLSLGMELDELKTALTEDQMLFQFRGDRDVSFLPKREESLIETTGLSFIRRAFFQLREGRLFIMAFNLDPRLVDHYSVYTSFVKKYGEPAILTPQEAVWESGEVRLALERPLTVKYIDLQVFNGIIAESETLKSTELELRERFLNDF
ncbi:hypothetical protein AGMMS50267_17500 [Spirochaetia bacterium]|nr:hypothetical protein AGMMS50267_17500 [Spirochaetia bacterium]